MILLPLISALLAAESANAQCNPTSTKCPPLPGLASKDYSIDFTQQDGHPSNWTLADQAIVKYGADGADFTFAKRYDAPYIWTSFYFLFGRVEVVVKAAKGTGIVTGAVLMSDCLDEIDWEWSGSNFGSATGKVQTNVFGKGITGNYDRGTQPGVDAPTEKFHVYVLDWTPTKLTWSIDGAVVRTLDNKGDTSGNYQYPQTPSRLHLGIWNGGDQNSSQGVVQWVGGHTDLSKVPYTAFVKSVKITNQYPCSSWEYPSPFKGTWQECKCTNQTVSPPTPAATQKPINLPCTYTVVEGDYGHRIADKLHISFTALNDANTPLDWDKLLLGQTLKVPGGNCSTTSGNSTTSAQSGNSISTPAPPYSNTTTASPAPLTSYSCLYTVTGGDNGYGIAEKLHVPFSDLNDANPVDWDKLLLGQTLKVPHSKCFPGPSNSTSTATALYGNGTSSLPPYGSSMSKAPINNTTIAKPSPTFHSSEKYLISEGDYGYKIAEKLGCSFDELQVANPGTDWSQLIIGQEVNVCKKTPADNTNVLNPSQSAVTPTKNGTALSTVTVKPTDRKASDINEICVIKTTTLCPSTPAANTDRTTSTAIYINGSITVVPTTISSPTLCEYTVVDGDYGYKIAEHLGVQFDDLNKANPAQDWDKLLIGQMLKIPGDKCTHKITATQTATSTQTHTVFVGKNGTITIPPSTSGGFTAPQTNQNIPQTGAAPPATTTIKCSRDNCYNNMLDARYSSSVTPFCSIYMVPNKTNVPIPTYLGGCQNKPERVSSACKCIMTPPPATSTSTSATSNSSSSGPLTSTGSSQSSPGTLGTTETKIDTQGTTVISNQGSSPATLGTMTTSDTGSSPGTLGTTVTTMPQSSSSTLGTTVVTLTGSSPGTLGTIATSDTSTSHSTLETTGTTSGTSSTTPGTSSGASTGTLGTSGSISSTSDSATSTSGTLGTTDSTSITTRSTSGSTSSTSGYTIGTTQTTGTTQTSSSYTDSTSGTTGTSSSSSSSTSGSTGSTSSTSTSSSSSSSSITSSTSTPPTTSSSSSSSSSSKTGTPPSTPQTTNPPPPSTPPTVSPPPPKTPPTTSSYTTKGHGWADWNGGEDKGKGGGGGSDWDGWNGGDGQDKSKDQSKDKGDAGKGGRGQGALGGQGLGASHGRKRDAPMNGGQGQGVAGYGGGSGAPAGNGGNGGGGSSGGGGLFGKFGWGKRDAAPEAEARRGGFGVRISGGQVRGGPAQGGMGQSGSGGSMGRGMGGGSADSGSGQGKGGGSGGSGGGFGGNTGASAGASNWKRSPQDPEADTPGGAQGRPGWKRQADDEAAAAATLSERVTKTQVNTATNVFTANAGVAGLSAANAAGSGAANGNAGTGQVAEEQGYQGTLSTKTASVKAVTTGTARKNAAAASAGGVGEEQGYQGSLPVTGAAGTAATGATGAAGAGVENDSDVGTGSGSGSSDSGFGSGSSGLRSSGSASGSGTGTATNSGSNSNSRGGGGGGGEGGGGGNSNSGRWAGWWGGLGGFR